MASPSMCQLDTLTFRLNPEEVSWNFEVFTHVEKTLGGRVVQVTGAQLSDITVRGQYGEDHYLNAAVGDTSENGPGRSWKMAERFITDVRSLMIKQSPPSNLNNSPSGIQKPVPMRFFYPPRKWDFLVYIKSIQDTSGGAGVFSAITGKFSFGYQITLLPVQDNTLKLTGDKLNTDLQKAQDAAIAKAISRISDGVGWKKTGFNDPSLNGTNFYGKAPDLSGGTPGIDPATGAPTVNNPPPPSSPSADNPSGVAPNVSSGPDLPPSVRNPSPPPPTGGNLPGPGEPGPGSDGRVSSSFFPAGNEPTIVFK